MRDRVRHVCRSGAEWLVAAASMVVPAGDRREFRDEWRAEIASHWLERGGPPDARAVGTLAARAIGAVPDAFCLLRQEWSFDMLLQDLRYALRLMWQRRALTALVVLTLAIGIGANTAAFSVLDGVLLRPLPYPEADRLLMLWEDDRLNLTPRYQVAPGNFADWRDHNRSFTAVAAWTGSTADLTGAGEPVRIFGAVVSTSFFDVLRVPAALGRTFTPEDAQDGRYRVVVLSHGAWQRHFSGDPAIVGREIRLSGNRFQVIGVMPRTFAFPERQVDLWRPLVMDPQTASGRAVHFLRVIGRLAPGVTLAQAQGDLDAIAGRAQEQFPATNDKRGITLVTLQDQTVGDVRSALYAIGAAVGIVLLIGCANVANLLLAAGNGRRREIAVRAAMGAGRMRIVRQLLVEGLALACAGGAAGVALAYWATRLLATAGESWLPRAGDVVINVPVLLFASAVSLTTGLLVTLLPAFQASRTNLQTSLAESARTGPSRAARRSGNVLVVVELALAVVLVIGAGLAQRSFWRVQQTPLGAEPGNLLVAEVSLPQSRYPDGSFITTFTQTFLDRVQQLNGIEIASAVNALPLSGSGATSWLTIEGRPRPQGEPPEVGLRGATPDYFKALRIPLLEGETFTWRDGASSSPIVVINRALADRFFAGERAIGRRIRLGPNPKAAWRTIVGIVGDVRHQGLEAAAQPEVYLPYGQMPTSSVALAIRTAGDPLQAAPAVRAILQSIDKDLPLSKITTMEGLIAENTSRRRFTMLLLAVFAGIALLLAVIGVYGLLAYAVSQRSREIGVRIALGAQAGSVIGMVVREGLWLAGVGLVFGLGLAWAGGGLIRTMLFEIAPTDPVTYAAVSAMVLLVAAIAAYVPARRAARVDPMAVMRS